MNNPVDPVLRKWPSVPAVGWKCNNVKDMFCVLSQLSKHLIRREDPEGVQLLARLWGFNNPLLLKLVACIETDVMDTDIFEEQEFVSLNKIEFEQKENDESEKPKYVMTDEDYRYWLNTGL